MTAAVATLSAEEALSAADDLGAVLADCVAGNASVSFMPPFGPAEASAYFHNVAGEVARGETVLLAARAEGRILGTVQLGLSMPPNQPHRGDVKKLLVHRDGRNRGLGEALMRAVEPVARDHGRSVLVLDTASDVAERLYRRLGWQRVGTIPDYALMPDGSLCDTAYYWKKV